MCFVSSGVPMPKLEEEELLLRVWECEDIICMIFRYFLILYYIAKSVVFEN